MEKEVPTNDSKVPACGYQADKIRIIHNGVSFKPWRREQWCDKERIPTFIYAGRYSPYKGIDVAVEAIARIRKDYPEARLWIIGRKDQKYVDKNLMPICNKNQLKWEEVSNAFNQFIFCRF